MRAGTPWRRYYILQAFEVVGRGGLLEPADVLAGGGGFGEGEGLLGVVRAVRVNEERRRQRRIWRRLRDGIALGVDADSLLLSGSRFVRPKRRAGCGVARPYKPYAAAAADGDGIALTAEKEGAGDADQLRDLRPVSPAAWISATRFVVESQTMVSSASGRSVGMKARAVICPRTSTVSPCSAGGWPESPWRC